MIQPAWSLKECLSKNYKSPKNKIQSMEKNGEIIKILRGLYETDKNVFPPVLAASIYGPSYISFEYALSFWGMIPERVSECTSATTGKNKSKFFKTSFGNFSYGDVPLKVYPYDVLIQKAQDRSYLIATKEKALCDLLYKKKPAKNLKELESVLFDDLRIDENIFFAMDKETLKFLCPLYAKRNLTLLLDLISRK